jgi:hypothetical protein
VIQTLRSVLPLIILIVIQIPPARAAERVDLLLALAMDEWKRTIRRTKAQALGIRPERTVGGPRILACASWDI